MRTGLTTLQSNILDQNVYQDLTWLFEIDLGNTGSVDYYLSTKKKIYGGQTYSNIDGGDSFVIDFTPIKMHRAYADVGIMAPSSILIAVDNKGSSLVPTNFEGAAITVRLVIKADIGIKLSSGITLSSDIDLEASNVAETEISAWSFIVKSSYTMYQSLYLQCVDWLSNYMTGDYPNTPLISTLWTAANVPDDNVCVPKIWGSCYFPIRWTKADVTGDDLYVLGEYNTGETHTIVQCRDPITIGNTVYPENDSNNTFTITENKEANNGNYYSTATFIINDSGSNAFWERNIHPDMPCKYSNSATVNTKNPIEQIKEILLDFGVPESKINNGAYLTAKEIWRGRGLRFNTPLWYKRPRTEVLAHMLMQCNTRLIVRDQIFFKVNSTASQHTINNSWVLKPGEVGEGMFTYRPMSITDYKDSGHILYRPSDKSIDDHLKVLVSAKTGTNYISDTTLDCLYIEDSSDAQKIGKMALQRLLFPKASITCVLKPKCLQVEVGDMLSIEGANYNALSNYNVLLDEMSINRDGSVQISATVFRDTLNDWDDISVSTIVVIDDNSVGGFYSVYSGRETLGSLSGDSLIEMNGSLILPTGEDIILRGSDTDPAQIKFQGSVRTLTLGLDTYGNVLELLPSADQTSAVFIGGEAKRFFVVDINADTRINLITSVGGWNTTLKVERLYIVMHFIYDTIEEVITFDYSGYYPTHDKTMDSGQASQAWDDVYADDFQNVADFYYLDDFDDLEVIEGIKPSGKKEDRTGLPLIDDNSLPDWMLTKDKKTGLIARDFYKKPYISLRTITSLLLGGVRKLIQWVRNIDERLKILEERHR
jgi:hypothetical protein